MPNAAIINYGQRADLLLDLIEGKAEAVVKADQPYWNKQTANFARGIEYVIPHILETVKAANKVSPQVAAEFKGKLTAADKYTAKDKEGNDVARRQKIHSVTVKAGTGGIVIAYAKGSGIQLYLVADGKVVAQDESRPVVPHVIYPKLAKDITVDAYVVGGDTDIDYTLMHYFWSDGQS
jgi:hypothetical protein